jgi:hypothetical protein
MGVHRPSRRLLDMHSGPFGIPAPYPIVFPAGYAKSTPAVRPHLWSDPWAGPWAIPGSICGLCVGNALVVRGECVVGPYGPDGSWTVAPQFLPVIMK